MDRIRVIHDTVGHTLTIWLGDPQQEYVSTLTDDEVVVMKNREGRILGFEVLHYQPANPNAGLSVEATIRAPLNDRVETG
ncbi:MAG: DUF2283 domain-containing protein [Deltaproteobacteria bacterium]|nr:DUF2283 domain-containing protein [Deltaproteobacteria bacterium]